MPYITQDRRPRLDKIVAKLELSDIRISQLSQFPTYFGLKLDGDLNYLIFAFVKRKLPPNYNVYKGFLQILQQVIEEDSGSPIAGELIECSHEIRRRILAPYEDQKIIENGDVSA